MTKRPKTGGRVKGTPNKVTSQLRDAILAAADNAGGERKLVGYLTWLAQEQPNAFAPLLGKLLPKDVNVEMGGDLVVKIERSFVGGGEANG
jgi:hypothetical protein